MLFSLSVTLCPQALCYLCLHTTFLPSVSPARFSLIDLDRADPDRATGTAPESSGLMDTMPTGTSGGDNLQVAGSSSIRRRMFPDDFVLELHFDDDITTAAVGSHIVGPSIWHGGPTDKGLCLNLDAECCKRAGSVASTESCGSAEMSPLDQLRGREPLPTWGRAGSSESAESEGLCGGKDELVSSAGRRQRFRRSQPRADLEDQDSDEPAGGGASSSEETQEEESVSPGAALHRRRRRRYPSVVVALAENTSNQSRAGAGGPQARPASRISAAAARLQASCSGNGRRGFRNKIVFICCLTKPSIRVDDTETD